MRKSLFTILFLLANLCYADTWLSLGGGSTHFCHTCSYNNFNPGLGLQVDYSTDIKIIGGGYYNSFYKASFYGGSAYQPLSYGIVKFGIMGALVSNYNNLKIPAMALPVLSIEGESIGIDILGGPSIGNYTGLISANLKIKL